MFQEFLCDDILNDVSLGLCREWRGFTIYGYHVKDGVVTFLARDRELTLCYLNDCGTISYPAERVVVPSGSPVEPSGRLQTCDGAYVGPDAL